MASSEAMSAADTAWLHMDRPNNLMVISGALWFDEPLDWTAVREVVSTRLVERFPRFRQRVVESRMPLRGPHWEDDPDFDLDLHLHHVALPALGDRAALQDLLGDLIAQPLDRSRPLWSWYFVDGYGPGSALIARMHHCIADGIALARVLLSLTDSAPDAGIEPDEAGEPAGESHGSGLGGLFGNVLRPAGQAASLARSAAGAAVHEAIEIGRHPSALADLASAAGTDAKALGKVLLPRPDTETVLKGPLGIAEQVAWSDPIPLAEIKAAGRAHSATVNDVLVAAVTGGLRTYLAGRGGLGGEVSAFVPFNLRPLDQPLPRHLGNRFGLVRLALPIEIADPLERVGEVRRRMGAIKHSPEGALSYGFLGAVGAAPAEIEQRLLELFSAAGSVVLTNVPGPAETVYLAGTPVRGVLVWAPTSGSVSMSISIFRYDGEVTVGVMSDRGLVPYPGELVAWISSEFSDLLEMTR